MRMKEMCERFKKFLFPSPVLEDDVYKDVVADVTPEEQEVVVEKKTVENVKGCKHCGNLLEDSKQDFCNNYCESMYRLNERFKNKYGVAKCEMCGKEFVKHSSTQKTCGGLCEIRRREILDLATIIADEENYFDGIAPSICDDACSEIAMRDDDNSDSAEVEENFLPEIEDDNCTVQCDCVSKDTRSEETQENLTEIPQESEIKCAFCGEKMGRLNAESNGEYCFCSEKCFKYFSHYGKSRYYGVEKCSRCGKEFFKHYKNQKQCYDCEHKSRYF